MYIRSTVSASTNSVMLIEPVPFSSSAFSSSGVNWTYRPLENSYPLIMSSFSTFSPSFEQTYCCFRRAPSFLCSQLNEIAADDSPAENILIGTETSPKEIVAEPIECAGIGPGGERVTVRPAARDGRGVEILGRAQRAVARSRRQTPRRSCRGSPDRVRRLRGDHPRRELRRGCGDRVGPWGVGADRGSGGGARQGEAALRAA